MLNCNRLLIVSGASPSQKNSSIQIRRPFPPDKSGGSDRLKPVFRQSPLCHPNPRQICHPERQRRIQAKEKGFLLSLPLRSLGRKPRPVIPTGGRNPGLSVKKCSSDHLGSLIKSKPSTSLPIPPNSLESSSAVTRYYPWNFPCAVKDVPRSCMRHK